MQLILAKFNSHCNLLACKKSFTDYNVALLFLKVDVVWET
jgi:hypothetical protein